jgi:all-trans-8'-apo-beta-carotenal 15,15'-oxygenase
VYYSLGASPDSPSPPQGIGRYDSEKGSTTSWFPENFQFCGEPMYAPRFKNDGTMVAEDDGYILSVLFDGRSEQSELLIFSANQIDQGPITRIPLGFAIPHGLFGVFTADPDATWPEDTISRRAKLADKIESRGSMWNEVKSDFAGLG